MMEPAASILRRILGRCGIALAVVVLATLYSNVLSTTPGLAATSKPHVGATCAQAAEFPHGSAVVGIAETRDNGGYWIVTHDGYVAACGDAPYLGEQTTLNAPVVGIAATPDEGGYYLVASDGGVFTFGDAQFQGSTGSIQLNKPVVGMTVDPATWGYRLVATDGGIFAYNAPFYGSAGSIALNAPIVGMEATASGHGYRFIGADGGVFTYGTSGFYGTPVFAPPPMPQVTAVGDSIMLDYQDPLKTDVPGIDVDAAVGRQWDEGESVLRSMKATGRLGSEVIVGLGTNGPISDTDFDVMMSILGGASRVVFVNVHVDRPWQDPNNAVLALGATRYRNVVVADWATLAAQNPQWFGADGTHLAIDGPGADALASLVSATLTRG